MTTSASGFRVLHALRLRNVADQDALRVMVGDDLASEVPELVDELTVKGLARTRTGRVEGVSLTKEGRQAHGELLAEDRPDGPVRDELYAAYLAFLEVNQPLIDLCTSWQVREDTGEINDHTDADYDQGVIARLDKIHAMTMPVCEQLAGTMDRFGSYGPRFDHAITQVHDGEEGWFTRPMIDSYHTIWFELHEDLLLTLEIERAEGR